MMKVLTILEDGTEVVLVETDEDIERAIEENILRICFTQKELDTIYAAQISFEDLVETKRAYPKSKVLVIK